MKYILALDQGTTSSRAIVFDKKGQKLCLKALPKEQYPWNEFSKNLKKL